MQITPDIEETYRCYCLFRKSQHLHHCNKSICFLFFLNAAVLLVTMADIQPDPSTQPEQMDEDEPFFSNLDLFLFSLIAGLLIYWLIFRKKTEPIPEFKKLETA